MEWLVACIGIRHNKDNMNNVKHFLIGGVLVLALAGFIGFFTTPVQAAKCGDVETSFDFGCPANADEESSNVERNPIYFMLLFIINLLSLLVGIAAAGFIAWGGIMYASAGGNADQTKRAISYITNAVIGLLLFLAMFAIANYLIPGGIFT